MNWLSSEAYKTQRNCLPLLTSLILLWVLPVILCQAEDKSLRGEHTNVVENSDIPFKQSNIHWTHHDKKGRHLKESTFREKSKKTQRRYKEGSQKPLKGYFKHKKPNRNRNKLHVDSGVFQEDFKKNNLNYLQSEKKYFDYFPMEVAHKKLVPLKDEEVEVVLLQNDTLIKEKILKSSAEKEKDKKISRAKRQVNNRVIPIRSNYDYVHSFVATEQGDIRPVLGITNRVNPIEQYHSQGTGNDPWNNRFTQPLNNFYLPVPHQFVSSTHIKHPIAGIYHNAFTPSGNHPFLNRPSNPSLDSRFGDEDRVIWEINYVGGAGSSKADKPQTSGGFGGSSSGPSSRPAVPTRPPTTRAPPTRAPPAGPPPSAAIPPQRPSLPPARDPPPPLIHSDNRRRKPTATPSRGSPNNIIPQRPISQIPTTRTTTQQPARAEPSKCVWAIVSCCSRNDLRIRYNCFEQIGCHGAFWDYNPCADNIMDAALKETQDFFQR